MKDLISGLLFAAISIFFWISSYSINDPGYDILGPRFLPQLTLVAIFILSQTLLWSGVRQLHTKNQDEETKLKFDFSALMKSGKILGILVVFSFALVNRIVSFEVSGIVFMLACGAVLVDRKNKHQLIAMVLVGVIIPLVVGYAFKTHLFVNLP